MIIYLEIYIDAYIYMRCSDLVQLIYTHLTQQNGSCWKINIEQLCAVQLQQDIMSAITFLIYTRTCKGVSSEHVRTFEKIMSGINRTKGRRLDPIFIYPKSKDPKGDELREINFQWRRASLILRKFLPAELWILSTVGDKSYDFPARSAYSSLYWRGGSSIYGPRRPLSKSRKCAWFPDGYCRSKENVPSRLWHNIPLMGICNGVSLERVRENNEWH